MYNILCTQCYFECDRITTVIGMVIFFLALLIITNIFKRFNLVITFASLFYIARENDDRNNFAVLTIKIPLH